MLITGKDPAETKCRHQFKKDVCKEEFLEATKKRGSNLAPCVLLIHLFMDSVNIYGVFTGVSELPTPDYVAEDCQGMWKRR